MAIDSWIEQNQAKAIDRNASRKRRADRWAAKDRTEIEKHVEMPTVQRPLEILSHRLDNDLRLLGSQRDRMIQRSNFHQKLFVTKQAIRHKDNPMVLSTLNYVRQCCQYGDIRAEKDNKTDKELKAEQTSNERPKSNEKPPESMKINKNDPANNDQDKSNVEIQKKSYRLTQSAHVQRKSQISSAKKLSTRQTISADATHFSTDPNDQFLTSKTTFDSGSTRVLSGKRSIEDFRQHPERYLSASNRYLPLLRRQAAQINRETTFVNGSNPNFNENSEFLRDDVKSFLSDDVEGFKRSLSTFQMLQSKKLRAPTRIDLMDNGSYDPSEQLMALACLRERELNKFQRLVKEKPINRFVEPMTVFDQHKPSKSLAALTEKIDSLRCSDSIEKQQRAIDIETNQAKLAILIF